MDTLAYIYWDPQRFAFTIPLIQRPVAWYGICFMLGFLLGFILIVPIIRRKLEETDGIFDRDIVNWPAMISYIKEIIGKSTHPFHPLFRKFEKYVTQIRCQQEPSERVKTQIIETLNAAIKDTSHNIHRKNFENAFPKAIRRLRETCLFLTDRLTWFVVIGTLIGARLGHVFFYEWPHYQANPIDILKVWEGGLASHGGTLGVIAAIFFYQRKVRRQFPEITFLSLLDILSIPSAMAAIWIRIGNFINQEILGPPTSLPWAVIFGHPADGGSAVPRHPTQLYEAVAYLATFAILFFLWKKRSSKLKEGVLIGLFMMLVFGSRFLIEFVKAPQHSQLINESFLSAGQYLSIPFILFGFIIYLYTYTNNFSLKKRILKNTLS